jgi:Kef-type K+ transport system membrane component KefB
VLGWIHVNSATTTLSSLGIVVLMFMVGLELRVSELARVGVPAVVASIGGIALTIGAVLTVVVMFNFSVNSGLRAAMALAATSAGVGARVLTEMGLLRRRSARVVLAAAVLDDVIVLLALSGLLTAGTAQSIGSIVVSLVTAFGFIALVAAAGPRLAKRHGDLLSHPRLPRPPFVFALALCLGLAALAERVGLAALVGAFLAGMVLAETRERDSLEQAMQPLYEFLVPFFFVLSGAGVDVGELKGTGAALALALTGTAVAAKFVGAAFGGIGLKARERVLVGCGMIPRGEVTIAAASAALAAGEIDRSLYAALLAAVFATAVCAPILVRAAGRAVSRP